MRLPRWSVEAWLAGAFVLIGLCWGGFLGASQLAGISSALDRFENLTVDWRFSLDGSRPAPDAVVIAAIDEETVRQAGGYPLPRDLLARMVRRIAAHQPRAIAVDLLFLDPGKPEADQQLADAFQSAWTVIAAVGVFDAEHALAADQLRPRSDELARVPSPAGVHSPIAPMREAALQGLVNLSTDHGGVPRHVPMIFFAGGAVVPSFALAAASGALRAEPVLGEDALKLGDRLLPMDLGYHLPLRYYGPRGSIRRFSAARALREDFDAAVVRGRVVLIGATAIGLGDTFATPYDRVVPGIEIFATAVANLLAGDALVRSRTVRWIDAAAAVLLPCLIVLLMTGRRTAVGIALATMTILAWIAAVVVGFRSGYWLSMAVPLAASLPVVAGYGLAGLAHARYAARRLAAEKAVLSKFQSPRLLAHLLAHPEFLEEPSHQAVAVVFVDLSGFTGLAESVGAVATRDLLAQFHALVERDVDAHDGLVGSFMGDGAMILFGLPRPLPDDGVRAFRTVMQLDRSLAQWCAELPTAMRIGSRIGAHAGLAIVSRLGPVHHQHVTATGDTVNVASRLMEVAKQQGAAVVVSDALWAAAGSEPFAAFADARALEVDIRGRAQPLRVRILR
jgi:adenylate cyclase